MFLVRPACIPTKAPLPQGIEGCFCGVRVGRCGPCCHCDFLHEAPGVERKRRFKGRASVGLLARRLKASCTVPAAQWAAPLQELRH